MANCKMNVQTKSFTMKTVTYKILFYVKMQFNIKKRKVEKYFLNVNIVLRLLLEVLVNKTVIRSIWQSILYKKNCNAPLIHFCSKWFIKEFPI